jgi:Plasmid pRiA4b ORF-3-like protein
MPVKPTAIYQLKITLRGSKPPIWRQIQVHSHTTLPQLHQIIQLAMGWHNCHLHQFIALGNYYGEVHPEYGIDEILDEKNIRLDQCVSHLKDKFFYEYDFGDGWEHQIVLEKILEEEPKTHYPICIKGKRNCPPEDIGGVWSYGEFLEAIEDQNHPSHDELLEWVGGSFDPEKFDLTTINKKLQQAQ